MRAFANFLTAKRQKTLANGASFVFREIIGGVVHIVQTKLPTAFHTQENGGIVPLFIKSQENGIYSTTSNGIGFYLGLDDVAFDADYAEFQSTLAIELQDEPTTLQEGIDRVAYLNNAVATLKTILSMG